MLDMGVSTVGEEEVVFDCMWRWRMITKWEDEIGDCFKY